jgi:hypothetical protein
MNSRLTPFFLAIAVSVTAADKPKELTPGGVYVKGDMKRPRPSVIAPPLEMSQSVAGKPPGDAVLLFDGKDLATHWTRQPSKDDASTDVKWKVADGYAEVNPKSGTIQCKERFGSAQLHVEWATPAKVEGKSQGRGNSGILLSVFGEIQVLDSYENDTYPDGQAGALYGNYPPLVNVSRKPGEWQSYDIIIELAQVEGGKITKPARLTVLQNGVIVQHAVEKSEAWKDWTFALQDHHNPVRYRNIWVRPLHRYDENAGKPTSNP